MTRVPFCFVDVFARHPLTGNPLSLVPDADDLTEPRMRAIAREFNQSETTFILRPSRAGATRRLRSFTPIGAEVYGAGHNALGAWLWLAAAGRIPAGAGAGAAGAEVGAGLTQEIGDDVLPVQVSRGDDGLVTVTMDQSAPRFGGVAEDRAELAGALGLSHADLVPGEQAQVVDTGAGHLLVPVRDRAAVDRAVPVTERLAAVLRRVGGEGCYLYSRDPVDDADAVAYTRFFNPTMGIAEDPATGTAAGPLVARLVADGKVAGGGPVIVEQGYKLGRPSRIQVSVAGPQVRVGGSGLVVAEGTLTL
ncbi:MAG TPA: PhzF family phenazine biosynthesis protein [Streptosporangiaceae bacterium]